MHVCHVGKGKDLDKVWLIGFCVNCSILDFNLVRLSTVTISCIQDTDTNKCKLPFQKKLNVSFLIASEFAYWKICISESYTKQCIKMATVLLIYYTVQMKLSEILASEEMQAEICLAFKSTKNIQLFVPWV